MTGSATGARCTPANRCSPRGYDSEEGLYVGNSMTATVVANLDGETSLSAVFPDCVIQAELDVFFTFGGRPDAC